jgi:endo-1,4-beta-D-glucanase Y
LNLLKLPLIIAALSTSLTVGAAQLLEKVESESGALLPQYTGLISVPFTGIAVYGNKDGVEHATAKLSNVPGVFRIDLKGASSDNSDAGVSVYIDSKKVGAIRFSGKTPTVQSLEFELTSANTAPNIRFILETDTGANDTFLDSYELYYVGKIPISSPPPPLPAVGAYYSHQYRNLFAEVGYSEPAISKKVNTAYDQLFHSASKDRINGEAILIDALDQTQDKGMAFVWDTGNNDVRSEGMSYGMMIAVQMNRQDDFNKIWAWANKYSLNTSGDMKGYFGWRKNTDGTNRDSNPAPDGEEYYVTALFFASNRWGDGNGIYNYRAEANKLLDNMIENGQTHYVDGKLVSFSLFDKTTGHILFSPFGEQHTDPSYHLPAFYELWALWASHNNDFWSKRASESRKFLKTAVNPTTGLNPDYANFDGSVVASTTQDHKVFYYDAWRTIGNAAMDYAWWKADEWQVTYAKTLHAFLKNEGVSSYSSLYTLEGKAYNQNKDHSPGLVGMNAMGALASDSPDASEFVKELWNTPTPKGEFRYYDGTLYMFSLLAASGNYKIYCPNNGCGTTNSSSSSAKSSSSNSRFSSVASSSAVSSSAVSSSAMSSSIMSSSPRSSSSLASSSKTSEYSSSAKSTASSTTSSSSEKSSNSSLAMSSLAGSSKQATSKSSLRSSSFSSVSVNSSMMASSASSTGGNTGGGGIDLGILLLLSSLAVFGIRQKQ